MFKIDTTSLKAVSAKASEILEADAQGLNGGVPSFRTGVVNR